MKWVLGRFWPLLFFLSAGGAGSWGTADATYETETLLGWFPDAVFVHLAVFALEAPLFVERVELRLEAVRSFGGGFEDGGIGEVLRHLLLIPALAAKDQPVGRSVNDEEDEGFTIVTGRGKKVRATEINVKEKAKIPIHGNSVKASFAWAELEQYFVRLKASGVIAV